MPFPKEPTTGNVQLRKKTFLSSEIESLRKPVGHVTLTKPKDAKICRLDHIDYVIRNKRKRNKVRLVVEEFGLSISALSEDPILSLEYGSNPLPHTTGPVLYYISLFLLYFMALNLKCGPN